MNGETLKTSLAAIGVFLLCDTLGIIPFLQAYFTGVAK